MHQTQMISKSAINSVSRRGAQPGEALPSKAYDSCADYQLFRCAIMDRVDDAWGRIYQTYSPLVFSWVLNHPCFWKTGEDAAYFVNRAFEKMWIALIPDKFDHFPDLPSLLKYLQTCVHSVIIDDVRKVNQRVLTVPAGCDGELPSHHTIHPMERILEEMWRTEVWERIRRRLSKREEQIIFYRFLCDLKPRQICEQFPDEFPSVDEIYVTLQNVLGRLRRDQKLKQHLAIWIID